MKRIKNLLVLLGILSSNLFAQDDFIPPPNFEYNQSRLQSFYLFINADIDGVGLEEGDWIGSFSNDVCVGSWPWQGEYTALPIIYMYYELILIIYHISVNICIFKTIIWPNQLYLPINIG